jgi:hypothetical protein
MKMTKIALVAMGLCAGTAFAQEFNAKVYGTLDAAMATASNQPGLNSSQTMFAPSGDAPSLIGVVASKKLANGITAAVQYEAGVNSGVGSSSQGNGTGLFNRQANISFTGGFGRVGLGLQLNPAFLAFAATDPRGISNNNSGLGAWINSAAITNGAGNNSNDPVNIFDKNAFQYSLAAGGFSGTVGYAPGGATNGTATSLGLVYGAGDFVVSAGTVSRKGDTTTTSAGDSSSVNFGVAYTLAKKWRFAINSNDAKNGDSTVQFTTTGAGVNYAMDDKWSFNVAYYTTKDKPNNGQLATTTLGAAYAMDKSVGFYAQIGSTKTDATGFGPGANWAIDAGGDSGFKASPGNTVQTIYVGTKVSF